MLGGIAALAAGSTLLGSAAGKARWRRNVPIPDVEGPITGGSVTGGPQTASVVDVSERGYVEEEYFISGEARHLASFGSNGPADTAEYATRVLVYRPRKKGDFNGTLVVNWPNVSLGLDVPTVWVNTHEHLLREGYAAAIISAQAVGVDDSFADMDLKTWDPVRYGDLTHPGDAYSFDIFSQGIQALKAPPGQRRKFDTEADPLGGLNVKNTLAGGLSQSAGFLTAYINQVQEHAGVIDGFMPLTTGGAPEERGDIRDDLVPVMFAVTEDEADEVRRPDGNLFKLWEVAGASHVNFWLSAYFQVSVARDFQGVQLPFDPVSAGQYGQLAADDPRTTYGECEFNYYPVRYAYRAALDHLQNWVKRNREPPAAPRIEREVEDGEVVDVVTDEFGNARGGLRLPPLEVPVAQYDPRDEDCGLFGKTHRLDPATLGDLYGSHAAYVADLETAVDEAVDGGFMLRSDGEDLLARAADAVV